VALAAEPAAVTPSPRPFEAWTLPALELAPALLGLHLVRSVDGELSRGEIVETEAYPGGDDLGSHSSRGRTRRTATMFEAGGAVYVYLIYGLHHCVNIVSGPEGSGEAVLIRALRPIEGIESMRRRRGGVADRDLCRGPGRLAAALSIDRTLDGVRLGRAGGLWIEPPPEAGPVAPSIRATPRIGLGQVGEWALRPWRFHLATPEALRWVSGPAGGGARRSGSGA